MGRPARAQSLKPESPRFRHRPESTVLYQWGQNGTCVGAIKSATKDHVACGSNNPSGPLECWCARPWAGLAIVRTCAVDTFAQPSAAKPNTAPSR